MKFSKHFRKLVLGNEIFPDDFKRVYNHHIFGVDGWMSEAECHLLFSLAKSITYIESNVIVEIGSYKGKSSISIASGMHSEYKLMCVDPHTGDRSQVERGLEVNTEKEFIRNVSNANLLHRIIPIVDYSMNAAKDFAELNKGVSMLFIDGWHSQDAVANDIEAWERFFGEVKTIVFDDFLDNEVQAGIQRKKDLLPPYLGSVGKVAVYSNDPGILKSNFARYLKRKRFYDAVRSM